MAPYNHLSMAPYNHLSMAPYNHESMPPYNHESMAPYKHVIEKLSAVDRFFSCGPAALPKDIEPLWEQRLGGNIQWNKYLLETGEISRLPSHKYASTVFRRGNNFHCNLARNLGYFFGWIWTKYIRNISDISDLISVYIRSEQIYKISRPPSRRYAMTR